MKKQLLLLLSGWVLAACAPGLQAKDEASLASNISSGIPCDQARSKVFDVYYQAHSSGADLGLKSFRQSMNQEMQKDLLSQATPSLRARYQKSLEDIHQILTEEIQQTREAVQEKALVSNGVLAEHEDDDILHLIRLEMRSQIEPQYALLNARLDQSLAGAQAAALEAGLSCSTNTPPLVTPPETGAGGGPSAVLNKQSPLYGALYTMATAYQSCQVLDLPAVTAAVEEVEGVVKGKAIDSVGFGREYTDVKLLKKTHYYHRGQTYGPNCANQDAKPLVYDYGGEPVVNATTINVFKNSGGGGALGIDCSAFVSTAAAVAGNLYSPSTTNKPFYSRFNSRDFINASVSGWGCYQNVKVSKGQWIQPGDIAGVVGHVVMIDKVGEDPFGLSKVKNAAGCADLNIKNFDFSVIQSSSVKNSLGINRFIAKDYLPESSKMMSLFLGYAKQACLSQFDGTARNPVTSNYGIIRHQNTAKCLAPKVVLTNEACVSSCSRLN